MESFYKDATEEFDKGMYMLQKFAEIKNNKKNIKLTKSKQHSTHQSLLDKLNTPTKTKSNEDLIREILRDDGRKQKSTSSSQGRRGNKNDDVTEEPAKTKRKEKEKQKQPTEKNQSRQKKKAPKTDKEARIQVFDEIEGNYDVKHTTILKNKNTKNVIVESATLAENSVMTYIQEFFSVVAKFMSSIGTSLATSIPASMASLLNTFVSGISSVSKGAYVTADYLYKTLDSVIPIKYLVRFICISFCINYILSQCNDYETFSFEGFYIEIKSISNIFMDNVPDTIKNGFNLLFDIIRFGINSTLKPIDQAFQPLIASCKIIKAPFETKINNYNTVKDSELIEVYKDKLEKSNQEILDLEKELEGVVLADQPIIKFLTDKYKQLTYSPIVADKEEMGPKQKYPPYPPLVADKEEMGPHLPKYDPIATDDNPMGPHRGRNMSFYDNYTFVGEDERTSQRKKKGKRSKENEAPNPAGNEVQSLVEKAIRNISPANATGKQKQATSPDASLNEKFEQAFRNYHSSAPSRSAFNARKNPALPPGPPNLSWKNIHWRHF